MMHSPNVTALLKIKILSWSQQTGFPVCIRVRIADRTFNLHKLPLSGKSEYLREKLKDRNEVELPLNFPGGAETFEMMALFIYYTSSAALLHPSNIAALRCAAEFLKMREECERLDMYLNQVVLQSWDHTLMVLHTCTATQTLLPWAEDLLIVSRCIETTAFMACMEILDPERRRETALQLQLQLQGWPWSQSRVRDMMSRDAWIEDVISLPLPFFKRVIASLRRQGMKDKYVSPIILLYAHKWVLSETTDTDTHHLHGVLDLVLGSSSSSGRVIPVGFYLSLLAKSKEAGLSLEKLQSKIASVLHLAGPKDLLLPQDGIEVSVMERIFMDSDSSSNPAVSQLWDQYLNQVAADPELCCNRFITLIQALPTSTRQTHDHLYAAINAFFQSHPDLPQEEKGSVCKYLDCQKLSRQVCIEAVQNEVMPLRLMVQALYVQHSNTQQALEDSFRESSGSLGGSRPLDTPPQPVSRKDYESTSFRIENLEKELMSLKKSLELQQISKRRENCQENQVGNKNINHQFTSCIGSVSFDSQRKYAKRILTIIQRLTLFGGGGRSRRKTAAHHL